MTQFSFENLREVKEISLITAISGILPAIGLILGEGLLTWGLIAEGLSVYLLLIVACTLAPIYKKDTAPIFSAFILLAVFRLTNLAMPVFAELTLYWIPLVYIPFAISGGYLFWRMGTTRFNMNWRGVALWIPLSVVGGIVLAEALYRYNQPPFLLPEVTTIGLGLLLGIAVLVGVVEEILFRGILQSAVAEQFGVIIAVGVASIVFGVMQVPHSLSAIGLGVIAGLAYGVSYSFSSSLLAPVVFHSTINILTLAIFPVYGSFLQMIM